MSAGLLLQEFDRVADSPDATRRLRRFVLALAVRGRLSEQLPADEPASQLIEALIAARRGRSPRQSLSALTETEKPFTLPPSWEWIRLGEALEYDAGDKRDPSGLDPDSWLLELEDIESDSARILAHRSVKDRNPQSTKSGFKSGDVLYGKLRPYLNKVVVAREAGYSTTEIVAIRPLVLMSPEYICLALRRPDFVDYVTQLGRGTKMPRLRTEDALSAPFPLPPVAEQHRIVAKVEELMALCDQSEAAQREREARRDALRSASLQRLTASNGDAKHGAADAQFFLDLSQRLITRPQHVADLRQTILDLAVRGRLAPQDSQDETVAKLLGARVMRDDRAAELWSLPAGWEWSCLAKLGEQIGGGTPSKSNPNFWIGSIPWVSPKDMKVDLILDAIDHVSTDAIAASTTKLVPVPALLMVVRGMILSHSFPSALSGVPLTMNQDMKALIPFRADLAPMLLLLVKAMSEHVLALVQHSTHGTCRLNTADLFGLPLPIPPLAEQHRIVAKVDELMRVCDDLEAALSSAQSGRGRLLEALLHEALEGPEVPDLVRAVKVG